MLASEAGTVAIGLLCPRRNQPSGYWAVSSLSGFKCRNWDSRHSSGPMDKAASADKADVTQAKTNFRKRLSIQMLSSAHVWPLLGLRKSALGAQLSWEAAIATNLFYVCFQATGKKASMSGVGAQSRHH